MNDFGVLNNRKRALIALIHSLAFLRVAIHGFAPSKAGILSRGSGETGDFILIGIYLTVASILAWMVSLARCAKERMYFGLCTGSATFGLLRTVLGTRLCPRQTFSTSIASRCITSSSATAGRALRRKHARDAEEAGLNESSAASGR